MWRERERARERERERMRDSWKKTHLLSVHHRDIHPEHRGLRRITLN